MTPPAERERTAGRPRLTAQRHRQIIEAFVGLLAAKGLESINLDDVASSAGVQRAAIRHFVGNREALIEAALEELSLRYSLLLRDSAGRGLDALLVTLFEPGAEGEGANVDWAFHALHSEALRQPQLRSVLRSFYDSLEQLIANLIRSAHPDVSTAVASSTAYQIICLAQTNSMLQHLGMPRARATAAHALVHRLLEGLDH